MLGAREKKLLTCIIQQDQENVFCKQSKIIAPESQACETQDERQAMFNWIYSLYCVKLVVQKLKKYMYFVWLLVTYFFINKN